MSFGVADCLILTKISAIMKIDILKIVLDDVFTLGADDSVVLKDGVIILANDYPLHSKERAHLRTLIRYHLDTLRKKEEIETPKHYLYYDDNSKVKLSPIGYKLWLEENKYAKYFPVDSPTYTFIKIEGKFVEETIPERIKEFVLDYELRNSTGGDYAYFNYMACHKSAFEGKFLSMLESTKVEFLQDTDKVCYLYYLNCVVAVTKDGAKTIEYKDINSYVWKNQVIQREYKPSDHHDSEFRTFLWFVSNKDMKKYKSIQSVFGYLMHSYKTTADNRAIILNDSIISDNPDGRSGKGLFCKAIGQIKKMHSLNGKDFDFNKQFKYQGVKLGCQVLVFDDVKKNFAFENLFSVITEGIDIEYKGQDAARLPVEKSPKVVITTNYTIGGTGGSHEARKFEVEFSNYFSVNYTPEMEFGHRFFEGWNAEQWSRFDNFAIRSIQVYLQDGLIKCDFDNIDIKKYIKEVGSEFHEFTQDHDFIVYGERVKKSELWNRFFEDFPDSKKFYGDRKKKNCIKLYCMYYGYEVEEGNSSGFGGIGRWLMLTKKGVQEEEVKYVPFDESLF